MNHTQADRRPHVLLLTCHDIGRHLGCYGVRTVHTPHLDALASGGVRFERAFTVAPSCSPSRATLATGRYPHSNGVMGLTHPPFGWDLARDEVHLAERLRASGYETHLFGHQHVTTNVNRLGFDHRHGFDRTLGPQEPALGQNVLNRLAGFLQEEPSGKPLYLEINLEETHRPFDQGGAVPDESRGVSVPPYLPEGPASLLEMAALQGAISQADEAIGRILTSLDDAGLMQNMMVIFLADHGIAMPRAKCTLYDPGLEVALIMRWPGGGIAGGQVLTDMISNVDLLPTLLEALDLPVPPGVQGASFLPLLRGEAYSGRNAIYAEKTFHSYYDPMRAVRTERFKYIRNFETAFAVEVPGDVQSGAIFRTHVELYSGTQHPAVELYDLEADPLEQRNLAAEPAHQEVERRLDAALWAWMAQTGDPLLEGPVASPAARQAWQAAGAARARE